MALVLSEEQQILKDTAKGFFTDNAPVSELRRLRDERDETGFSRDLWKQMAEMGFAGLLVPEENGGVGLGFREAGLVFEEMGRTLAVSPMLSTAVLGATILTRSGTEAQKELLAPLAGGELITALAVDEGPRHAPANTALSAAKTNSGYRLSGTKTFVLDGHVADKVIVAARTSGEAGDEDGITLFLVDAEAKGLSRARTQMVDNRNAATLTFDDVDVTDDDIIGGPDAVGAGFGPLSYALDAGNLCLSAEMHGASQETFERTLGYLQERKQFGQPIGSFQGLQHRAAHLFSEVELGRSLVLQAMSEADEGAEDLARIASMTKAKLSQIARLATNEGVQMHGGIGMTDEFDIGFFMKRARAAIQTFGDEAWHVDRFARLSGY